MIETGSPAPAVPIASDLGSPTLLLFFKRSCMTCEIAMPVLQDWNGHAPEVQLVGVSQDSVAETDEFFAAHDIEMDVVYDDGDFAVSEAFDLDGVPTFALIEDGRVSWISVGWHREQIDELGSRLTAISGRDVELEGIDALPAFRPG
ncbi:MAG: redoxin domain-containing protein [Acidimicrobiia bacterium]|nr:redoxin domain-containing protein [Acidimicrobiia bacterium]